MKTRAAVLSAMGTPGPYAQTRPLTIEELKLDPPGPGIVLGQLGVTAAAHTPLVVDHERGGAGGPLIQREHVPRAAHPRPVVTSAPAARGRGDR